MVVYSIAPPIHALAVGGGGRPASGPDRFA